MTDQILQQYILHRVQIKQGSSCWWWNSFKSRDGYGACSGTRGHNLYKTKVAHRLSYIAFVGGISSGLVVRHMCHNKACVRPCHLKVGTKKQNSQDSVEAGHIRNGVNHPKSIFTEDEVRQIRSLHYKLSQWVVAELFQCSVSSIKKIQTGDNYKYLLGGVRSKTRKSGHAVKRKNN